jgi:hypothetical protein
VRARDNRHKAEELAAVVRWLTTQADAREEDATAVELLDRPGLRPVVERWRVEASILADAAARLQQGEHHA